MPIPGVHVKKGSADVLFVLEEYAHLFKKASADDVLQLLWAICGLGDLKTIQALQVWCTDLLELRGVVVPV